MSIAAKLRLTQRTLANASLKELAARFRAVNPATGFNPDRARKWLNGVASPRDPQIYNDWAAVIGSKRNGAWIASCSLQAFIEELVRALEVEEETLIEFISEEGRIEYKTSDYAQHINGYYISYSRAFSRYYAESLVRGMLTIIPRPGGRHLLRYSERFNPTDAVMAVGSCSLAGDILSSVAISESHGPSAPFHFMLRTPGPPAPLLFGLMLAISIFGPVNPIGVTPIVAVRVDPERFDEFSNSVCYLASTQLALADDVKRMGFAGDTADLLTEALLRVMGGDSQKYMAADFNELMDACSAMVRDTYAGGGNT